MSFRFSFEYNLIIFVCSIPDQLYEFKALDVLNKIEFTKDENNRSNRKMVDICAVIQAAGELSSIMIKSQGKELSKVNESIVIQFCSLILA